MKKIIIVTIIAVAVTILLLSATNKPQIQAEQPERMQPIITTATVTTALEAKESIATVTATAKLTTSITTTAPVNTATTTAIVTTSEKTNITTAPITVEQTDKTAITTQPPIKDVAVETTPENGTIKGDLIYIIGFGWVKNEGGGGEGIQDHEMKTNGNKIGSLGSDIDEKTPANGTVKGDKIYVCGFGWIDYEGGGGIGEVNEQMYQNGNKIGYFG